MAGVRAWYAPALRLWLASPSTGPMSDGDGQVLAPGTTRREAIANLRTAVAARTKDDRAARRAARRMPEPW